MKKQEDGRFKIIAMMLAILYVVVPALLYVDFKNEEVLREFEEGQWQCIKSTITPEKRTCYTFTQRDATDAFGQPNDGLYQCDKGFVFMERKDAFTGQCCSIQPANITCNLEAYVRTPG